MSRPLKMVRRNDDGGFLPLYFPLYSTEYTPWIGEVCLLPSKAMPDQTQGIKTSGTRPSGRLLPLNSN